jgi:hypothetical protein
MLHVVFISVRTRYLQARSFLIAEVVVGACPLVGAPDRHETKFNFSSRQSAE